VFLVSWWFFLFQHRWLVAVIFLLEISAIES